MTSAPSTLSTAASTATHTVASSPAAVRRRRRRTGNTFAYVVLSLGAVAMIFPFVYQTLTSFMTNSQVLSATPTLWPTEWHFENYAEVFTEVPFASQMVTTTIYAVCRTAGQVLFCTLAGYAFARMQFRGRDALFGLLLSMMMVPGEILLISQYQIVQAFGWLDSLTGLIVPGLVGAFGVFLMRQFFLRMPRELEEAGRLDGAGPIRIFWQIMLPLAKPGISALAVIMLIGTWGELLWPLLITTRQTSMPVAPSLATFAGQHTVDYPVMMAASLISMLPVIIAFMIMQRRVIEGLAFSGVKG
ncbi:MAG: carbohydrate ABC transporter permease [Thermomicrobiales bacterium]